jgi:transcriptional regulator with XRE-family HTH domain
MAKKYSELQARMSPAAQALARDRAKRMLADMPLQGLRQARRLSQETLAANLGISQPQVSKIEHSTDLYLSTLRRYVQAMGGELEIVARLPEGVVRITQFQELEPDVDDGAAVAVGQTSAEVSAHWGTGNSGNWGEPAAPACRPCGWKPKLLKGGRGGVAW